jgi:hypothetical protein
VRPIVPLAACLALLAAPSAAMEATAGYVVTLGGINIASATIDLRDDGTRYAIDLDADVIGLGNLVAKGDARAASGGVVDGDRLRPDAFTLETVTNGDRFTVSVQYAGGSATAFMVEPPLLFNYGRVPIERAHLSGATDMMSAFLLKGGGLNASLCDRSADVFTGLERFDIAMRFVGEDTATSQRTGYQGPVILCAIRYLPVSGHFPESEITRGLTESERILIWYAPLGETGYFIPYRVLLTTAMGDLSMILTRLNAS